MVYRGVPQLCYAAPRRAIACVRVCVRACVRACLHPCIRVYMCVFVHPLMRVRVRELDVGQVHAAADEGEGNLA